MVKNGIDGVYKATRLYVDLSIKHLVSECIEGVRERFVSTWLFTTPTA